jgi:hypothetical protein
MGFALGRKPEHEIISPVCGGCGCVGLSFFFAALQWWLQVALGMIVRA